ncbi:hypothetical protein LOCC1_G005411 [Lachnellula occidentalis]|uniref:BTB domain-containing protein n=1 Tax=Lachnellula occidentalis TaxID=215460 RepID=A0A8H8UDM9_9HELO|nr:hypothetical protein LOCC1_G005411 [Lachnellula occidentalis]
MSSTTLEADATATGGVVRNNVSLLKSGKYSDMRLETSDGKVYHLHRSIVCSQSKPLAAFMDGNFQEAQTGTISLFHDDPQAIEKLVDFLYKSEYSYDVKQLPKPSFPSTTATETASNETLLHTKVYVLAEKYDVPALKTLASQHFKTCLPRNVLTNAFVESLEIIFTQTPETDRLLKDIALEFVGKNYRRLSNIAEFIDLCKQNGDVAGEVIRTISTVPALADDSGGWKYLVIILLITLYSFYKDP